MEKISLRGIDLRKVGLNEVDLSRFLQDGEGQNDTVK